MDGFKEWVDGWMGRFKEWVDGWVRGGWFMKFMKREKKGKVTLSFTSPEKGF
jgi:hypothetical protein